MRTSRNLLIVAASVVCCLIVIWLSTSIQGGQKTYEVQPQITIPEYRTDAARAIDAYERLMERYMNLTERDLFSVGADVQSVIRRLDRIDDKLTELCARMARIERALGIEQPTPTAKENPQPKSLDRKAHGKPSPPTTTD